MSTLRRQSGLTLVEAVTVVAIVALLVGVALPGMNKTFARSDINAARENVLIAIRKAKTLAKAYNTTVTLTITTNTSNNKITMTVPSAGGQTNVLDDGRKLQDIQLPEKVSVTANTATYKFNAEGMVNNTGTITVTSTRDNSITSTISINTLLGQVTVN